MSRHLPLAGHIHKIIPGPGLTINLFPVISKPECTRPLEWVITLTNPVIPLPEWKIPLGWMITLKNTHDLADHFIQSWSQIYYSNCDHTVIFGGIYDSKSLGGRHWVWLHAFNHTHPYKPGHDVCLTCPYHPGINHYGGSEGIHGHPHHNINLLVPQKFEWNLR